MSLSITTSRALSSVPLIIQLCDLLGSSDTVVDYMRPTSQLDDLDDDPRYEVDVESDYGQDRHNEKPY